MNKLIQARTNNQEVNYLTRIIAALVHQAGGSVRISNRTMSLIPLRPRIVMYSEPGAECTTIEIKDDEDQSNDQIR